MLNFKSVRDRLTFLFVLLSAASTLVVGLYFIISQISSNNEQVETYRTQLAQQYDRELKMQTDGIISAVEGLYKEQQAGRITEAEAKRLAMDVLRNTRFDDGKGYFSVDERRTGICVVHPIQGAKVDAGGGFVNYSFPKPGESTDSPKRTYVGYFQPYDWVIDTGSYIDYIDARANEYADEMQSKLNSQIMISVILLIIVEVVVVLISMRLAQSFADPITFVTRRLGQFAEGDYRKEPIREDWVARNDEIGGMMHSIGNLGGSMRSLLNTITGSADKVAADAAELTERTDQSSQASHSVAVSITDVAGAANNQLNAVNDATQAIDRLAETMNRVSTSAADTAANTRRAAQAAQNGQQVVTRTVSDMEQLSQAVESSAARIRELGARSDTIGQITDTISNIAEQTNLLALNAAIEAARAGEHGRGFAVVADEVRKLAEQSHDTAENIQSLTNKVTASVQNLSNGAFGLLKFMEDKVSKDYALINETADQYRGDAEYLRGFAQKSNTTSKELSDSVETMGNAMEEIAKATHEGAVGNTTVAEKVTLVAQKANDILDKINISQQGAENLKQQVAKFKV